MGWRDPAGEAYDRMRAREWERQRARIWAQEMQRQQGGGSGVASSNADGLGCLILIPLVLVLVLLPVVAIFIFDPILAYTMTGLVLSVIAVVWGFQRYHRVGPMGGFRSYVGPFVVGVLANGCFNAVLAVAMNQFLLLR